MKRLNPENINNPEESERIFKERWREQLHYIDWERFRKLAKYYKGGDYLDIGCFNSPMPFELANDKKYEGEIWACDHCEYVINTLKKRYPEVHYILCDIKTLPDKKFDYIVAGELIEHIEDPAEFIKDAVSHLNPGGTLALSTPLEEKLGEVSMEHLWSFTDNDIMGLLRPYGEVELSYHRDTTKNIIAYLKKI